MSGLKVSTNICFLSNCMIHIPQICILLMARKRQHLTNKLYSSRISVYINKSPEWSHDIDAVQKHTLVFAVYAVNHVAIAGVAECDNSTTTGQPLRDGFGPISRPICQIRASVSREATADQRGGVVGRESET